MYSALASAKGKLHAQVLQALSGWPTGAGAPSPVSTAQDEARLLGAALACARDRVVVKRSKRLPPLVLGEGEPTPLPSSSVEGTTTRFDVYHTGNVGRQ
jgi:hypothetical protein